MPLSVLLRGASALALGVHMLACSNPPPPARTSAPAAKPATQDASATVEVRGQASPAAVVELEPIGVDLPLPEGPVIMDQYGKAFVPETLLARVGQTVEFRNSEDIDHNIQVLRRPTGTTVMNESGSQGEIFRRTFEPGVYDVNCDVHPGMRGVIIASRTPYVAIADGRGQFAFPSVPAGPYTLKVSEDGRVKTQVVEARPPETVVPPSEFP